MSATGDDDVKVRTYFQSPCTRESGVLCFQTALCLRCYWLAAICMHYNSADNIVR